MSMPALSNMPPFEPNAFCMSTTTNAVREGSISTGSGTALIGWLRMATSPFLLI
jgi:hypothetical protein